MPCIYIWHLIKDILNVSDVKTWAAKNETWQIPVSLACRCLNFKSNVSWGEKLSKVNFYKFKWTGGRTCDHGYSTPSFIAENNGLGKIQVEGFREHQGASQFQTIILDNKSPSPRISRDPRDEKIHENLNLNIVMNRGSLK